MKRKIRTYGGYFESFMQTSNHKIVDYDAVLDAKFGKERTSERARAEEARPFVPTPSSPRRRVITL